MRLVLIVYNWILCGSFLILGLFGFAAMIRDRKYLKLVTGWLDVFVLIGSVILGVLNAATAIYLLNR